MDAFGRAWPDRGSRLDAREVAMNVWLVLPVIAAIALAYVLVPVALAMATRFRHPHRVRCPLAVQDAFIRVERAGLAEALARPSLRRVSDCSLWPARAGCPQPCRVHPA
jgi:hypothetical protein